VSFVIALTCGHGAVILSAEDVREKAPPEGDPWILYPLPDGDGIDLGDGMSCIMCLTPQTVSGIYSTDQIAFTSDGRPFAA
jgi:hypothetical protein